MGATVAEKDPADEHGSDIASYPPAEQDGVGRRIGEGSIPLVKGTYGLADDIVQAVQGDGTLGEASAAIAMDVGMMAAGALVAIKDPFYALADVGLTIVLELVQPLDDLLEMVSGDPDEMERLERVWGQVQTALEALSDEAREAVDTKIPTWSGEAAEAARGNLAALQASIWAMAQEAHGIRELLGWAKVVAEAIYAVIKSILSELVAWLIMRGLIALASSAWSFGASIAQFLLEGAIRAQQAVSRAIAKVQQAVGIFGKLVGLLAKWFNGKGKPLWKAVLVRAAGTAGMQAAKVGAHAVIGGKDAPALSPSGAAPGCVTVAIEELDALGADFDRLGGNAEAIVGVAGDAATADLSWGLPGLMFKGKYGESCTDFNESAGKAGPACRGSAERLKTASRIYGESDSAAVRGFTGIMRTSAS